MTNDVFVELSNGPRQIPVTFITEHIINSEGSFLPDWKENRFLIKENGEIRYIVLNKISTVDYSQVLLCQNHPELTLVSNDHKLLKSAKVVLIDRVIGPPSLIEQLIDLHPIHEDLKKITEAVKKIYSFKKVSKDYSKFFNYKIKKK